MSSARERWGGGRGEGGGGGKKKKDSRNHIKSFTNKLAQVHKEIVKHIFVSLSLKSPHQYCTPYEHRMNTQKQTQVFRAADNKIGSAPVAGSCSVHGNPRKTEVRKYAALFKVTT